MITLDLRKDDRGEKSVTVTTDDPKTMATLIDFVSKDVLPTTHQITIEQLKQLVEITTIGQKIACIKFIREITKLGLKEAKELVDQNWRHQLCPTYSSAPKNEETNPQI